MRKLFKGGNTVNEYRTKNCQNAPAMCGRVVMFPCSQINEFQSPPHLLNYSCPHCCEWTFPHHDCANFWSLEAEREGENKTEKAFSCKGCAKKSYRELK